MNAAAARPITVLLVEDDPGDVLLIREAFEDHKLNNSLLVAGDGVEALELLRNPETDRPDLVLLDLNLPRKDGREVLAEIKEDDDLKLIPVLILTTSQAERDILDTYGLHANGYISKPLDLDEFAGVVESIKDFWFTTAKLPQEDK